jgi:hypothetical protein
MVADGALRALRARTTPSSPDGEHPGGRHRNEPVDEIPGHDGGVREP